MAKWCFSCSYVVVCLLVMLVFGIAVLVFVLWLLNPKSPKRSTVSVESSDTGVGFDPYWKIEDAMRME
jgi:hypothetical protein